MQTRFPPLILFSTSKQIGASGICSSGGIIFIAKNFPLWWILIVLLHELAHYFFFLFPKYLHEKFTGWLDLNTMIIMELFPEPFKEKLLINTEQLKKFIEWQCNYYYCEVYEILD